MPLKTTINLKFKVNDWFFRGAKGKKNAIKEFEEAARAMDMNRQQGGSAPVYDKASQKEILKAMGMFGQR